MIRKGTRVSWAWGQGTAQGRVREIIRGKATRTIEGEEITRNGSTEDPAYLIEQEDGSRVLKRKSEVTRSK